MVPAAVVVDFAKFLEREIWAATQLGRSKAVNADKGIDKFFQDPTLADTRVFVRPPCDDLVLNFVGRVTTVAAQDSLKICDCFGKSFYLDAAGVGPEQDLIQFIGG